MFVKWNNITLAADNYSDIVEFPIGDTNRKQSIASYNFKQKTMFFSHINKIEEEIMDKDINLVKIRVLNPINKLYTIVCSDETQIGISRGDYVVYPKVKDLRPMSNILIDDMGMLCKIVGIEKYYDDEKTLYDVKSNKAQCKFINHVLFKA